METRRRGTDGRRIFSPEFKREQIARVVRKEVTVAELSRELSVERSVVRRWKHPVDCGSTTAVGANEEVVPGVERDGRSLREHAQARLRQRRRPGVGRGGPRRGARLDPDYNAVAPHSALEYQAPKQYRAARLWRV